MCPPSPSNTKARFSSSTARHAAPSPSPIHMIAQRELISFLAATASSERTSRGLSDSVDQATAETSLRTNGRLRSMVSMPESEINQRPLVTRTESPRIAPATAITNCASSSPSDTSFANRSTASVNVGVSLLEYTRLLAASTEPFASVAANVTASPLTLAMNARPSESAGLLNFTVMR